MHDRMRFLRGANLSPPDPGRAPVSHLAPHDHACLIYDDFEKQIPTLIAFLQDGFARNERVACYVDEPRWGRLSAALKEAGTDLDGEIAAGSFLHAEPGRAYLAPGRFDPEAVMKLLSAETDKATALGRSGLRVLGEAAWAAEGHPGSELLMEYEARLADFFPNQPCTALCLYDRAVLPAKVLRDAILTHPLILYRGEICENAYFIPPEDYKGPVRDSRVVDSLLTGMMLQTSWMKEADREIARLDEQRRLFLERFQGIAYQAAVGSLLPSFTEGDILGVTGYEKEEFSPTGIVWDRLVHPNDRPGLLRQVEKVWSDPNGSMDMEYRIIRKDGSVRWVRDTNRTVVTPEGQRVVQGTIRDVTSRKLAEEQVKNNAARLACLLEIARHPAGDEKDLLTFALEKALLLTKSKLGYVYCYDEKKAAFTLSSWSRSVAAECGHPGRCMAHELAGAGLWAEPVRRRKAVRVDDYGAGTDHAKGLPEGHPLLRTFLSVPVLSGESIVAVIGVANKDLPYNETDELQLTLLMDSVWKMVEKGRAETAVLRAKEMAANYLEITPAIILVLDNNGDIRLINEKGCEILECTREEALEANWFTTFLPREILREVTAVWQALMEGRREPLGPVENEVVTGTGRRKLIRWHNRLLAENGKITGVLSSGEDVTEQRETEEALRYSEERYRTTLYSIGDGVITTDLNGRVVQMNPVAELMTGWTEREARTRPIAEVFVIANEFTKEPVESPVPRVLREGLVVGLANHTVLMGRDGKVRPIADSGAPIRDGKGQVTGVVLVFADQSDRRQMEEELRQSQKMEAIGRLAGGIAHDFNNMLGVIIGNADLALLGLTPSDPLYHDLKEIDRAARRSADLTRQLLAFARKQPVSPRVLDLAEAVEESSKMLGRLIGEGIGLSIKSEKGLRPVLLDPAQLDQVLANLVVNARDAIDREGTIVVGVANRTLAEGAMAGLPGAARPGDYVVLSVTDDGCGMDESVREHLFEPFFTTKEQGKGTGLGLCTVHGIVSQNQGFLDFTTAPGRGTTFRIWFPAHKGAARPAARPGPAMPLAGKETILLVEDEEQVLDLVAAMLKRFGYQVLPARNPGDALLLCERHPAEIHLLVTDVIMPLMNGKDLKDRLVELRPSLRSLFMSGYTEEIVAGYAAAEGREDFLQKPFTAMDLAKKVREILDRPAAGLNK